MEIVEIRCLRGPNVWSTRKYKLVVATLDLEAYEELPTNQIDGFYERLKMAMPSLHSHHCSEGHEGGFFERVKDGTWMGHVVEHIALELQTLAGMDCGFGRTRGTGQYGVYQVVFQYQCERAGILAAERAVAMVVALAEGQRFNVQHTVNELRTIFYQDKFGPSTDSIVSAARARNIPVIQLNDDSLVQLGYGSRQQRIEATLTQRTSYMAVELAGNKFACKKALSSAGIPVPEGAEVASEEALLAAVEELGFPLVVKPLDSNHGKGVTTNIKDTHAALEAYNWAMLFSGKVVVERYVQGADYRLLVIGHRLKAAARRIPASVFGDGVSTIRELIHQTNLDPRRGEGHQNLLTSIAIDTALDTHLGSLGLTLDSVVPSDQQVIVSDAANLSKGGTSEDVTDALHPEIARMAEHISRIVGLDICGVDIMATDVTQPLEHSGTTVIEVNASPGFRMHLSPLAGKPRNVGADVVDMLFPAGANARIPVIAITGTNGKTTTTRLTAHLMGQQGDCVGYTTTDGVYIDGRLIEQGDCTGPESAHKILTNPTVDVAVLETARGGILRSGLGFDQCDVGVITNIASDHLGMNGIQTLEDMRRVKSVVAHAVRPGGYAVLNAENEQCVAVAGELDCNVAYFSINPSNEHVLAHTCEGCLACVYQDGYITIIDANETIRVEPIANIPAAFGGKCRFMIENILAAVLAAYCQGARLSNIKKGLVTFQISDQSTPGRLNHFHFSNFEMVVDYAHNPHGLHALGQYLETVESSGKLGIITGVGDRRDEDIRELGKVAATYFDEIIIRVDDDLRGRDEQEMVGLVRQGILSVKPFCRIRVIGNELKAVRFAIKHSRPGQLIVLLSDKFRDSIALIKKFRQLEGRSRRAKPMLAVTAD
ncbi:cyanophycin synthetase [Dyadobacter sp. 676]|uniref:Cyanophycin synthetase n=1 Tax=Dyadobacter sp. 676 TaxID=3088362 RepID=A0AAU8FMF0_9BACT